jgi:hypothetical protein
MWQELKPKLEIPSGVLVENEKGINDRYKIVTSPRDIYTIYPNIVTGDHYEGGDGAGEEFGEA